MESPLYHLEGVVRAKSESMEDFDGPLDVILLLLSKNKIEIQDIKIASILEQYLAYLEEMKQMDMEIASEFIAMASHLMLIKTKMLLSAAEQEEAMSEMELLIRSLEERQRKEAYTQLQNGVQFLAQRNEIGLHIFVKDQEPLRKDNAYRYQHEPDDLVRAMAAIAERSARALPPPTANFAGIVGKEPYPLTKKAAEVLKKLISRGISKFISLFKGNRSRSEIVATFLAVLELCRLKSVELFGDEGGEISVQFLKMPDENDADDLEGGAVRGAE